jgi:hypothetical protein
VDVKTKRVIKCEPSQPIPKELVDAFFDRELDEGSRENFFGILRQDLRTCSSVARTQRMISALREPVEAPDLTDAIMGEVGRQRGFLPLKLRRLVKAGRLAAAACVLMALLAVAALHRSAPETFSLSRSPQPVSRVVTSGAQEAAAGVQQIAGAVDAMKARIGEPAAELGRLLSAEDLPEVETGPELRAARVYMVGGLTPDGAAAMPSVPGGSAGSIALYGGSGHGVPFVVPSVVYLEGLETHALVPMAAGADRPLPSWVGTWRQNVFMLQPAECQDAEAKSHVDGR